MPLCCCFVHLIVYPVVCYFTSVHLNSVKRGFYSIYLFYLFFVCLFVFVFVFVFVCFFGIATITSNGSSVSLQYLDWFVGLVTFRFSISLALRVSYWGWWGSTLECKMTAVGSQHSRLQDWEGVGWPPQPTPLPPPHLPGNLLRSKNLNLL